MFPLQRTIQAFDGQMVGIDADDAIGARTNGARLLPRVTPEVPPARAGGRSGCPKDKLLLARAIGLIVMCCRRRTPTRSNARGATSAVRRGAACASRCPRD